MKQVLITGASTGIGLATAQLFSEKGYRVFNLDKNQPQKTVNNMEYIPCDLSQVKKIESAIEALLKKTHTLDVLVSNAGQHLSATIEGTSEEDFDRIINLNLKGTFFLIKNILPIMKKQNKGCIILMGSDQSLVGKKNSAVYGATKAAIAQLAKSTALDYAEFNIRVNAVCPGTIDTPLYRNAIEQYHLKTGVPLSEIEKEEAAQQPLQRVGQPEEVAQLIYFLASDSASFITGSLFPIDGGYTAK